MGTPEDGPSPGGDSCEEDTTAPACAARATQMAHRRGAFTRTVAGTPFEFGDSSGRMGCCDSSVWPTSVDKEAANQPGYSVAGAALRRCASPCSGRRLLSRGRGVSGQGLAHQSAGVFEKRAVVD